MHIRGSSQWSALNHCLSISLETASSTALPSWHTDLHSRDCPGVALSARCHGAGRPETYLLLGVARLLVRRHVLRQGAGDAGGAVVPPLWVQGHEPAAPSPGKVTQNRSMRIRTHDAN